MIKEELNKIHKNDSCEDEIWTLKTDLLYNFNGYFPENNPAQLRERLAARYQTKLTNKHAAFILKAI